MRRKVYYLCVLLQFFSLALPCSISAATVVQAWSHRYGYEGISVDDVGQKITADSSGNVVVAGYCWSRDSINLADLVVIKYSSLGTPVWTNRYRGPGGDITPTGLVLDDSGKVYVTANSQGAGSSEDFLTIAYSSAGLPLWTNRYNVPGTGQDTPTDIKIFSNNTIVVSGFSWNGSNYDYAIIAYSSQGIGLWTNRFPAPNGYVYSPALAVDKTGNLFVSAAAGNDANSDYLTTAYSISGVTLWTNRFNGSADSADAATAIATDKNGTVFVTGFATDGTNENFTTIAYSGAGLPLWTNRCGLPGNSHTLSPRAIAASVTGDVFLTGVSWDGTNFFSSTVAYSNSGAPLWTNRYCGLENGYGTVNALAVDQNGNVFLAGYWSNSASGNDYATVAYSGAGVPLWTNLFNGLANGDDQANAISVDQNGNVFVTGTSSNSIANGYDLVTIAYSNTGLPLWTNSLNERGFCNNYANALAVDSSGNVFVTGYSSNRFSGYDYATLKYSSAGVSLWTNRYGGSANSEDHAVGVAVDIDGRAFVTGYSLAAGGSYAYTTIAYSSNGFALWTNHYPGLGSPSYAVDLAANHAGQIFVTGISSGYSWDFATVAYSASGTPLWTNRYSATVGSDDEPTSIAAHPTGNVAVTGFSNGGSTSYDYVTICYSADGVPLWTNKYNGPGNGDDRPSAVAIDANGNVFVTGSSLGSGSSGKDYATIGYSAFGTPMWTNRYNGPFSFSSDAPTAIALNSTGDIIVTGRSPGVGNMDAYATLAYSPQGVPLWTNRWNGPSGHDSSSAVALAIDPSDNVIVAGNVLGKYATIAYSVAGLPLWTNIFTGQILTRASLGIGSDGSVFLTGTSVSKANNYITVKCVTLPPGVSGSNLVTSLRTGIPNPNSNTVSFSGIPGNQYVTQVAPSVRGPWINLSTNIAEVDGTWHIIDFTATNRNGFYRSATLSE
jgi:uncharacterized delta-60 repeat protein